MKEGIMDPEATLISIASALVCAENEIRVGGGTQSLDAARDLLRDYTEWRKGNGYQPVNGDERHRDLAKRYRALRFPKRITMREYKERHGYADDPEDFQDALQDSVMYALCDEDCRVEPDGRCPHGNPSPLIAMGMM